MSILHKATRSNVFYAPISVNRPTKSTKVTIIRAKSKSFIQLVQMRTAQLVASSTGFEPLSRDLDEGTMYQ